MDTLRADHLGVYGYPRSTTPNIDRLAADGVVFLQNYAQAPNTSPSTVSFLTSLYPSVHQVWEHGEGLDPAVLTVTQSLNEAGYATGGFVRLNGDSYRRGFDQYQRIRRHTSRSRTDENVATITEWVASHRAQPFFLFLHFYDVHLPYTPLNKYAERYRGDYEGPLPDRISNDHTDRINNGELECSEEDLKHIISLYDAELALLDEVLGRIFDFFRATGLYDDTVFALLADHGEEFGDHGQVGKHAHTLFNELIRAPLIMVGPGIPKGRRIDYAVRNIDVAPTLLSLAGVRIPRAMQGSSLRPVWEGRERRSRVAVSERPRLRSFVVDGFKYYTDGRLFDLPNDPSEQMNLSALEPERVEKMAAVAADWDEELKRRQAQVAAPGEVTLTPEEVKNLKALGYLQ